MIHEVNDFRLELIDEPMQSHVVAWEQASRALMNEDAKPLLNRAMAELQKINITNRDVKSLINAFATIVDALEKAIRVLENNETLTMSANRGVMVKAAIQANWIVSPDIKPEDVDNMPSWKVAWIAERVGSLYVEVTTIPKN